MTQSVYIAGDISYVSGTVNGTAYTWTLTGDHVWSTNADWSDAGVYVIALTAVDTTGNQISVTTTAYYGLHLKTDWTDRDYYEAADLNRVGAAVEYIRDRLADNGYVADVSPKTNYTVLDEYTVSQMQKYLSDVQTLRDGFYGTQKLPGKMKYLTGAGANQIEKALKEVENLLNRMIAAEIATCGITRAGGII